MESRRKRKYSNINIDFNNTLLSSDNQNKIKEDEEEHPELEKENHDENNLFKNPIMRGYLSLSTILELSCLSKKKESKNDSNLKIHVCNILD